jgi:hypothetical protein
MAHTARTVLPTDLVALVSYDGKVYANEAMTRDRIGTQDSRHPLETAIEQWFSFATGRHTCVSVKGATLRGLVSARKRTTKQAWEVDCLIDASEGDPSVLMSLLDRITEAAGKSGAMRIFLRLPADSEIAFASTRCAFTPYVRETVYRRPVDKTAHMQASDALRRRAKADPYPVFQLYTHLVPPEVRRFEGTTFGEWTAAQESLGRSTQYVLDDAGRVRGWLRVAGDGDVGRFDLLGYHDVVDELVESALAKLANRDRAVTIVPEHQADLATSLRRLGFEPAEEYTALSRRTVRPVTERVKVPAVAQTTFG